MMKSDTTDGIQPLSGLWSLALDPDNRGRQDEWFKAHPPVEVRDAPVPGFIQQAFPSQHGVAWYWHTFVPDHIPAPGERALLRFHAVDYLADVWLNGQHLGSHEGGETPFTLDATAALLPGENLLAVRVLNPTNTPIDDIILAQVPHRNKFMEEDFQPGCGKNYGGIVQTVALLVVPAVRVTDIFAQPDVQSGQINVTITVRNDGDAPVQSTVNIAAGPAHDGTVLATATLAVEATPGETHHTTTLQIPHHRLWSLDDPYLYRIAVTIEANDAPGQTLPPRGSSALWLP